MQYLIVAVAVVFGGVVGFFGRPVVMPPAPVIQEKIVTQEVPAKVDEAAIVQKAVDSTVSGLTSPYGQIAPAALKDRLDAGAPAFIIDVREATELANGKIANSTNIPLSTLTKNLARLPADKNAPIFTYCAVGYRGGLAMEALRTLGYTNVQNLNGGFGAWNSAGLPVATS
ncbi:MAG TPA: rhodanese-like domain-containing protein [Chloroflexota bacterium]|nr:rhodanese-like domain-containing protein [Chloroflexota bacterium]